jgi:hypothetical protein
VTWDEGDRFGGRITIAPRTRNGARSEGGPTGRASTTFYDQLGDQIEFINRYGSWFLKELAWRRRQREAAADG